MCIKWPSEWGKEWYCLCSRYLVGCLPRPWTIFPFFPEDKFFIGGTLLLSHCSGGGVASTEPTIYSLSEIRIWDSETGQWNLWCIYNSTYKCGIASKYILPHVMKNKQKSICKKERMKKTQVSLVKKKKFPWSLTTFLTMTPFFHRLGGFYYNQSLTNIKFYFLWMSVFPFSFVSFLLFMCLDAEGLWVLESTQSGLNVDVITC